MSDLQEKLPVIPKERGIFCNRTLNLRSIRAIGYDMDYTLIHYRTEAWERRAFEHLQMRLAALGWPVEGLTFDPDFAIRGLVIDLELGNLIKPNRFGYVKRAYHGTVPLDYDAQREAYSRAIVDLSEPRWVFLNTFFSLSEACMYAQLVDLLDQRKIPGILGYVDLYKRVKSALDAAHMEGKLKEDITSDPERFIDVDPDTPLALLDQRAAGKKLLLITNSEWIYTKRIMSYAFDRFLPAGMTWRGLFDVLIVSARKPEFFLKRSPLFEVVSEEGLLRPALGLAEGGAYLGGDATYVERFLRLSGDELLYVGDHIYGDVHVSKSVLRWRTALIMRDLESEIAAEAEADPDEAALSAMMREKEEVEFLYCQLRLQAQRKRGGYGPSVDATVQELEAAMAEQKTRLAALDATIAPLARSVSQVMNPRWGPIMRAGNDKSHLARQIERSADIYTSRVSNFMLHTPYAYLRSRRGGLPHDPEPAAPGYQDTGASRAGAPTPLPGGVEDAG